MKQNSIVQIRERERDSGKISLYLVYRINGRRRYENTKLYLLPEKGKDKAAIMASNKETKRTAKIMQSKKILELTERRSGIPVKKKAKNILLSEWMEDFKEYKQETTRGKEYLNTINNVQRHLTLYAKKDPMMSDIDKDFCQGFVSYLRKAKGKFGKPLSDVTKKVYFTLFNTMLKKAVRDEVIPQNPIDLMESSEKVKTPDSERVYLDLSEVKAMAETDTKYSLSKQAFMFSCFCGLRISDIKQLRWKDIEKHTEGDGTVKYIMKKKMQKTQRNITYPLPNEAINWLPEKKGELVFDGLVSLPNLNLHIRRWAESAGITKHISFHTARHTFATMMLTLGADIYTTSKLLGHSRISTTEIYAKIIDKKKDEAISLIDKFFDK